MHAGVSGAGSPRGCWFSASVFAWLMIHGASIAEAEPPRITRVIKHVQAGPTQGSLRTAQPNDSLAAGEAVRIGGWFSGGGDLSRADRHAPRGIESGGNISVVSGGAMSIANRFRIQLLGGNGTSTGTGGNIGVRSGGTLTAGSLSFISDLNNSTGVVEGANLEVNVTNTPPPLKVEST